jgi:hypothetical protein
MKRNVSVMCVYSAPNCCDTVISGKIIKEMPGLVASGTHCIRCLPGGDTLIFERKIRGKENVPVTAAQRTGNHFMSKV